MKNLITVSIMLLLATVALGQGVAINETGAEPDPSAMLDVTSTEKGILVPRITHAQREAIINPATGLLIYQSDETPGFYYNAGSPATPLWKRIGEDLSQITGQWEKNSDNIFYNQGFVGVGTANPEAILDVSGGDALIHGITVGRGSGERDQNTVFGNQAFLNNTDGERNTAIGYWTMYGNESVGGDGDDNTAIGWSSMTNSSTGSRNTALGSSALTSNYAGHDNVALGYQALVENATGSANVAVGYQAGFEVNGGNNNILLGYRAGNNITTGSNNIIIGNDIEALPAGSNQMVIGNHDLLYGDLESKRIGIGTTAPTAQLHTIGTGTGEGNVLFEGSYKPSDPGEPPASGAGIRMMWYPDKTAFRVGRVTGTNWDKDSIGYYSVAMGYNTIATGVASTAMGGETTASGIASTAMGGETTASGYSSTAMGALTTAKSSYETVIGRLNSDYTPQSTTGWNENDRLFVIGNGTSTTDRSNAMTVLKNGNTGLGTDTPNALLHTRGTGAGEGNVLFEGSLSYPNPGDPPASGAGTRLMWYPDKAAFRVGYVTGTHWDRDSIGDWSIAMGEDTKATGMNATAMGYLTTSSGFVSTAMGHSTTASGGYSTAMGFLSTASGSLSTAMGYLSTASGYNSTAMGSGTTASGSSSTAMGGGTTASGDRSTAMGLTTTASGDFSTAMGYHSTASGDFSTAMGFLSIASGYNSTAMGNRITAKSAYETVIGVYNTIYTPQDSLMWNFSDRLFVIGNGTTSANRSNAMTVLKNGNTGLGTDEPTQKLDIDGQVRIRGGAPGNGKVLTSDADGVGSWQTPAYSNWTVAGANIYRASGNVGIGASNPAYHLSIGDNGVGINRPVTNTLAFHTSNIERLRIGSTGNVSIGSSSATTNRLFVISNSTGGANATVNFENQNASGLALRTTTNSTDGTALIIQQGTGYSLRCDGYDPNWFVAMIVKGRKVGINTDNPGDWNLAVNGSAAKTGGGSWSTLSDARLKTINGNYSKGLSEIIALQPVLFNYIAGNPYGYDSDMEQIGFVAQEVQMIFPEAVSTGSDGFLDFNIHAINVALVNAVKEQQAIISSQQAAIESHREIIEQLKQRIESLEEER